jgi:segregation and condensation protein A
LLARLLECKTFKDVATVFTKMMEVASKSVVYSMPLEEPFASLAPDPLERTPMEKLRTAYIKAFTGKEIEKISVVHLHDSTISVKEAVDEVVSKLVFGKYISFKSIAQDASTKLHVVVRFLAVLELYKQGFVNIDLSDTLGEMSITLLNENERDIDVNSDDWGEDMPSTDEILEKENI